MAEEIDVTEVMTKLYGILKPLAATDRKKVIQAALTLLGDDLEPSVAGKSNQSVETQAASDLGLPVKAKLWMQQNGIPEDAVSNVFHFDGESVELIIGTAPGRKP